MSDLATISTDTTSKVVVRPSASVVLTWPPGSRSASRAKGPRPPEAIESTCAAITEVPDSEPGGGPNSYQPATFASGGMTIWPSSATPTGSTAIVTSRSATSTRVGAATSAGGSGTAGRTGTSAARLGRSGRVGVGSGAVGVVATVGAGGPASRVEPWQPVSARASASRRPAVLAGNRGDISAPLRASGS